METNETVELKSVMRTGSGELLCDKCLAREGIEEPVYGWEHGECDGCAKAVE